MGNKEGEMESRQFEIYCDESGQELFKTRKDGDNFALIGGIWVRAECRAEIKMAIRELRQEHGIHGEAKWNRVSERALAFYKELVDLFFESELRFRVMVVRSDELDLKLHESDEELMFYKFYYFMLRVWIDDLCGYRVFTDVRTTRVRGRLKTLKRTLERSNLTSTVQVQSLPSSESPLMQLADVFTGAVGSKFHKRTESKPKLMLVEHIEKRLGRAIAPTGPFEQKFNVYRIQFSKRGE